MSVQVITDGTMAWIVGVPVPYTEDMGPGEVGPDEVVVSLPLDLLRIAVEAHRLEQAKRPNKLVSLRLLG